MRIIIRAKNIDLTQAIKDWIEKKLSSLEKILGDLAEDKFFGRGKEKVEIWVEIGKISHHHLKGEVFYARAQLNLPQTTIRAEENNEDLRTAINLVRDELQREIKKYRTKIIEQKRRKRRFLKNKLFAGEILRIRKKIRKSFKK
jgi:putative sigma-54 modulation protein